MRLFLPLALLALAGCANAASPTATSSVAMATCVTPGQWIDADGRPADATILIRRGAAAPAVVLGESHDNADDHRWQLQTLAGLYALNPHLAIGMEMFPRRLQPVLDRWTAGELNEADFLRQVEWDRVWGFDAGLYLPILHFARLNRLPLAALNVERALVARVARDGWATIPADQREGVGEPAAVTAAYRARLADIAAGHGGDSAGFERFVAAQSLWDRAMAEAIATTHRRDGRTVVAIIGRGHGEYRDGVIRQLADLGLDRALFWAPWRSDAPCNQPGAAIADGLFGLDAAPPPAPARRLGVEIEQAADGLIVRKVAATSLAAKAGLKAGDLITAIGGGPVRQAADLTGYLRRLPAGGWAPLTVQRHGRQLTIVVKTPVSTDE